MRLSLLSQMRDLGKNTVSASEVVSPNGTLLCFLCIWLRSILSFSLRHFPVWHIHSLMHGEGRVVYPVGLSAEQFPS